MGHPGRPLSAQRIDEPIKVLLPRGVAERIDAVAHSDGQSRSGWVRQLILRELRAVEPGEYEPEGS